MEKYRNTMSNNEITLRPWQNTDKPDLIKYANNVAIFNNLTDQFPHPYGAAHADWFIGNANSKTPPEILAISLGNKAIGAIGLHPESDVFRFNCELGYWLAEPFWGRGYVTQAVQAMVVYARENFNFRRLYARPYGRNVASQRVLEKAGFVLEAKFEKIVFKNEQFEDLWIYAYRL